MKAVILYETQPIYRAGLSELILSSQPDIRLFEAGTVGELNDLLSKNVATYLIAGIKSDKEGFAVFPKMSKSVAVQIFYENFDDVVRLKPLVGKLNGLVHRNSGAIDVSQCVDTFLKDNRGFCASTMQQVLKALNTNNPHSGPKTVARNLEKRPERLTRREAEIMNLLTSGKRNREISEILKLKASTISTNKKRIFNKMKVSSIVQLVEKIQMNASY